MNSEFRNFKISDEIIKTIEKLGYFEPTKVQAQVIPVALEGKDIIVKSQTGSGKTAAFGIPVCEKIEIERNRPQALILTPTRELCVQVKEEISNIGRFKKVRVAAVFGKQPFNPQANELKQRVHIVVGTPGRTLDHLERETLLVEDIKFLIIDEADKMLDMGFIEQVEDIVKLLPKTRSTMLFSATMSKEIQALSEKYMLEPMKIEIASQNLTVDSIQQEVYEIEEGNKFPLLKDIINVENPDSCIIFCRTKDNVDKVANKLCELNYSCRALHGGMEQNERLAVMKSFKLGGFNILVATDVAARGIDIADISLIVNYDVPLEKESYVHRIGRTGRAGKKGKAITLMTPFEKRFMREIEEYIGCEVPMATLDRSLINENQEPKAKPIAKLDKGIVLSKEITKIYLNAGKKKKLRAGDIVGAITSIQGITVEDIGIIDIQDNISYVDIHEGKGEMVIKALRQMTIKGKVLKVQRAAK